MKKTAALLPLLITLCFGQNPCNQPGVIFCSGFEGNSQEVTSAWGSSIVSGKLAADPGPFNTAGNHVLKLDNAVMVNVQKGLGAGYTRLYARYYQKFPAGYNWSLSHHHGFSYATDGGNGGSNYIPDGCTQTDWMVMEPYQGSTGGVHWYVYHPGKTTVWGDIFETNTTMVKDRWYAIESMVDLGTPTPTQTGANGILDMWLDGVHHGPNACGSWPARCGGVWFRTCASVQLRQVVFMSSAPAGVPQLPGQEILYDDLVVSTQPIGFGTRVPYFQIPLVITTSQLTAGTVGTTYSVLLGASGGAKNYTWTVANGSLPPGLTLSAATGQIRGTPTQAGTSTFTLRVTDQSGPPQNTDKQFSLLINPSTGIVVSRDPAGLSDIKAQVRSNKLLLQFPASSAYGTIRLLDALGHTVWTHNMKKGALSVESPVLPNGLYVGRIGVGAKAATFRFAVIR